VSRPDLSSLFNMSFDDNFKSSLANVEAHLISMTRKSKSVAFSKDEASILRSLREGDKDNE